MIDVLTFDPANVQRLFEQEAIGEEYGCWPEFSPCDVTSKSDNELARFINDLADALLLPLCDPFIDGMAAILDFAREDAIRRVRVQQRRERNEREYGPSNWQSADLVAEVEAVCGEGRRAGREFFFSCPWHADSTPSLHVNPETKQWFCFGCQRGGGVVDWRKARER